MVKVNYIGFVSPQAARTAFIELKPYRDHLLRLRNQFRPFQSDYLAIHAMVEAIDTAARHFGLDVSDLYASRDSSGVGGAR